jgi:hypothetical protein
MLGLPGLRNKIPAAACPLLASKPATGNAGCGRVGIDTSAAALAAAHDIASAGASETNDLTATSGALQFPL